MQRVVGLETEFGILMIGSDGKYKPLETMMVLNSNTRDWRENGSSIYMDRGVHPEYNTPECITVKDVILYDRAGERIVSQIFSEPNRGREFFFTPKEPKDFKCKILIFKNNRSDMTRESTFGCHENYMLFLPPELYGLSFASQDDSKLQEFFGPLIAFLATRPVISGSGWYEDFGKGRYVCSQRAKFIYQNFGGSTTGPRSLVSTGRDEALVGENHPRIKRLHLVMGESNMLEAANFLKVGTTYLLINLLENGCLPRLYIEEPVRVMQSLTPESICRPTIRTEYGDRILSAVDVQMIYANAAEKHLKLIKDDMDENQAAETELILRLWFENLHALKENNHDWLVGRSDWYTKKHIIEQNLKKFSEKERAEVVDPNMELNREAVFKKKHDLLYHEISESVLLNKMNKKWPEKRFLNEEEIEKARRIPPQNTRALLRGRVVSLAKNHGQFPTYNWDWVSYREIHADLSNPFLTYNEEIDLICETIKQI